MKLPSHHEQIISAHAQFICTVVKCANNDVLRKEYEEALAAAEANGWSPLANAVRLIAGGNRDLSLIKGLDEETMVKYEVLVEELDNAVNLHPDEVAKVIEVLLSEGETTLKK